MKVKLILSIALLCWARFGFSQTKNSILTIPNSGIIKYSSDKYGNDSLLTVEYVKPIKDSLPPAYYINGKYYDPSVCLAIDPKLIDSLRIEKNYVFINNTRHYGQVFIKLKKDYNPKLISLNEIKKKYTKATSRPSIFIIDNEIIKDNYDDFLVDEKSILKIVVDILKNLDEKLHVQVIRLITKTEENIKRANAIILR